MAKKKVFVSFDYDKDRHYKYLLQAWDANKGFEFAFADCSTKEIKSDDIPTVKGAITKKVNSATRTLVIIGSEANKKHKDSEDIGFRNWQNFEVARSNDSANGLVGVKIAQGNDAPEEMLGCGATWVIGFEEDKIREALDNV